MDQSERLRIAFNDCQGTEINVTAGARGTWTIAVRAGPGGIAQGGGIKIYRETCKFWLGFKKQADDPAGEDYCSLACPARETTGECVAELADLGAFDKSPHVAHILIPWNNVRAVVHFPDRELESEEVRACSAFPKAGRHANCNRPRPGGPLDR